MQTKCLIMPLDNRPGRPGKAIQILLGPHGNLHVLCDDGTLWRREEDDDGEKVAWIEEFVPDYLEP